MAGNCLSIRAGRPCDLQPRDRTPGVGPVGLSIQTGRPCDLRLL